MLIGITCLVCGRERIINPVENTTSVDRVVNIAGDYFAKSGQHLESEVFRLKNSDSQADSEKDGLRVSLWGGKYPFVKTGDTKQIKQKVFIEFLCDPEREGTETEMPAPGEVVGEQSLSRREEEKGGSDGDEKPAKTSPMVFHSYKVENIKDEDWGVLRMDWHTKYACEGAVDRKPSDGTHWGFFTWFIIVYVLQTLAKTRY